MRTDYCEQSARQRRRHPATVGRPVAAVVLLSLFLYIPAQAHPRDQYLPLLVRGYQTAAELSPAYVERWKETYETNFEWGYNPPRGHVVARLAAALYRAKGDEAYAQTAIDWLARQQEFKAYFPDSLRARRPDYADGLPALTNFFYMPDFIEAYRWVQESPSLTKAQRRSIEQSIAEAAQYLFQFPEWGPHNRAIIRAHALAQASLALPDHPQAATWRKMAAVLAADSWQRWEEEDAGRYQGIWQVHLIRYADAVGDGSLFDHPVLRYYFDYILHLMDPAGVVPDFGDSRWHTDWPRNVALMERAAAEYGDAKYRWAARHMMEARASGPEGVAAIYYGLFLVDAYLWAQEGPVGEAPPAQSREVMEDLVGKKIVFRDGWDAEATYLLLNYRDEGPYARMARDYLRHTIPVEEEKMHHGHADENAIVLLMSGGSVLLNDAGYRPTLPSGPSGEYRADYFHNRLVWRTGKRARGQGLWEFLQNSGAYRPVETEKIEFWRAEDFDVSRTRVRDERDGVQHDRIITWLKGPNVFVVFDVVQFLEEDFFTLATLWHGRTVVDSAEGRFVTVLDTIAGEPQRGDRALRIEFAQGFPRDQGVFELEPNGETNRAVYQALGSHYLPGQVETFVTVLAPVPADDTGKSPVEGVRVLDTGLERAGVGVVLEIGGEEVYVCAQTDLLRGILTDNIRPRYTFESGRVGYGPFSTDASFFYARIGGERVRWAGMHVSGVMVGKRVLFEARESVFGLQPDGAEARVGRGKWRFWEGEGEVK